MTASPIEDKMRILRAKYLVQLRERIAQIEELLPRMEANAWTPQDRMELQSQSHKLAGTGATYGFPGISKTARELEELLLEQPEGDTAIFIKPARRLLNICKQVIHKHEGQ